MTAYSAVLRVGAHTWTVDTDDDPDYGPLAGLRLSWAAAQDDGWPTQHDPEVLVLGVIVEEGTDFDDVDQGTTVSFRFTPDGQPQLVEFGGTVRDLVASPHPRGMVYNITAVSHLQKLREDYSVDLYMASGTAASGTWAKLIQDAAGVGGGLGIRPALPDPFGHTTTPSAAGFWGEDQTIVDATGWDALVGFLATFPYRAGATPSVQRGVLHYQLTAGGELLAAKPFLGTWMAQGAANAPLDLLPGVGGLAARGGNVPAGKLRTAATEWARQRIEPNTVIQESGGVAYRPHTGPDVVRRMSGHWSTGNVADPVWVLAGLDNPNQWATEMLLEAWTAPELVAGWFTLPTAQRILVAAHGIDPRHTPDGSGTMLGMLAGATLSIPPGGRWTVSYRLRRSLPDGDSHVTIRPPLPADALTWAELGTTHPTATWADLHPALTWRDFEMIGD